MNIFQKIAILKHINKNKDNITYKYNYDIGSSSGIHHLEIRNNGMVYIQMNRNEYRDDVYYMEYNLQGTKLNHVLPCEQSFFDKLFILKMYGKMLNYYVAKNGMPNNKSR